MYLKIFLACIPLLLLAIYFLRKKKHSFPRIEPLSDLIIPFRFLDGIPITKKAMNLCTQRVISLLKKCLGNSKKECTLLEDASFVKSVTDSLNYEMLGLENGPSKILKGLCSSLEEPQKGSLKKVSHVISSLFLCEENNEMFFLPFPSQIYSGKFLEIKKKLLMTNLVILFENVVLLKEVDLENAKNAFFDYFLCALFVYKPNDFYDWVFYKEGWFDSEGRSFSFGGVEDSFVAFCVFGRK